MLRLTFELLVLSEPGPGSLIGGVHDSLKKFTRSSEPSTRIQERESRWKFLLRALPIAAIHLGTQGLGF